MIGIFDSGLGGLTSFAPLRRLLPDADIVYFGDTGRVPYGTRSRETIIRYTREDFRFFEKLGVSALLTACGTVSSVAIGEVAGEFSFPVFGVLEGASAVAAQSSKSGHIGVIGTSATVASGSFEREIKKHRPDASVKSIACPLFIPLVENGFIGRGCEIARLTAQQYLAPFRDGVTDTLVLGCTHFPLLADIISDTLPGITLISAGEEAAKRFAASVRALGADSGTGSSRIYVSDDPTCFMQTARLLLGGELPPIVKTDIEKY